MNSLIINFKQGGTSIACNTRQIFEKFQKMDKVYRRFYQHELAEYQFTPNEIAVILFCITTPPDLDTATDIVRCKGISKDWSRDPWIRFAGRGI